MTDRKKLLFVVSVTVIAIISWINGESPDTKQRHGENLSSPEETFHNFVYSNLELVEFCPTVFKHGVLQADSEDVNKKYKVGESVTVTCNPNSPNWKANYDANNKHFSVYPNTTIQCQKDGTWSGPPRICVMKNHLMESNVTMRYISSNDCTNKSQIASKNCPENLTTWIEVDTVNGTSFQSNDGSDHLKTYSILFNFAKRDFLGFIIVPFQLDIHKVRVLIEKSAILSDNASQLPKEFYNAWTKKNKKIANTSTSFILAAYTDKVMIEIATLNQSFDPSSDSWSKLFFPIIEGQPNQMDYQPTKRCPMPPIIPNARNSCDTIGTCFYNCIEDYVMYDPINDWISNGIKLSCIEDKWSEETLPVCRKLKKSFPALKTYAPIVVLALIFGLVIGAIIRPYIEQWTEGRNNPPPTNNWESSSGSLLKTGPPIPTN